MLQQRWPILLILLAYLWIASQYAQLTPDWQAPDEPAHYNYIRQLADGQWPVMEVDDYNQAYQDEVIGSSFDSEYSVEPFTYEDYQPPLYYLLQTPVFLLTDGDLKVMRQVGVMLGGLTLILAYLAFSLISEIVLDALGRASSNHQNPSHSAVILATIFFAFLPQHIAMQASVNNDSLSELLIAAMLVWLLLDIRREQLELGPAGWFQRPLTLGILLGAAFLTKVTAYLMAPVAGLYLLWRFWGRWPKLWRSGLVIFGPALLLGSLWWLRNLGVYGWPDALGTIAHDAAVIGQTTTDEWVARYGLQETIRRFFQTTFRSFWGQFGWMGVVMDRRVYQLLGAFTAAVLIGSLLLPNRFRPKWGVLRPVLLVLLSLAGLNILLLVTYNLTFVQHQGRYLFASLIPLSLVIPAGFLGWLSLGPSEWWERWSAPLTAAFGLAMITLDLVALYWFIIPQLT